MWVGTWPRARCRRAVEHRQSLQVAEGRWYRSVQHVVAQVKPKEPGEVAHGVRHRPDELVPMQIQLLERNVSVRA
jgi:hypothetical protein